MSPRCDVCNRVVYLAAGDLPLCPVCATPLVEQRPPGASERDPHGEADVA